MLRITRDGEKIIDKKMNFKENLLSRRKQEKLILNIYFDLTRGVLVSLLYF